MLISRERNTLQLDYRYSYMGSKANFVHSHIHLQDQGRTVENPQEDLAGHRMDQLEAKRVRVHMDQASKVLADVGIEASKSETWVDGSLVVVGVEVACWRVQIRQKRSFQVRRIGLVHDRLAVVVRNARIQPNHSRIPGTENYWIRQCTSELGTQRRAQGSNCEESGTELRVILLWQQ